MPYVTDTHALIWYLTHNPRLSKKARGIFEKIDRGEDYIVIPCIIFYEIIYLIEKSKIPVAANVFELISFSKNYRVEPLCLPIIEETRRISREEIPDPWDRLIAATSKHLNLPLITRDESLKKIALNTIW